MIYLDNAATTWPKPKQVRNAVMEALEKQGGNPGRSGHKMSIEAGKILDKTRFSISKLFGIKDMNRIAFTHNATDALNLSINGILEKNDHVITSTMEHNSVVRPIEHLKPKGVESTKVFMDPVNGVKVEDIKNAIRENTKLMVFTHASNVTGTLNPIKEIAELCTDEGIFFLVDASQSAGTIDINIEQTGIDLLAFPGHKGLLGPTGTGGLYIGENVDLVPSRYGGTGIYSEMPLQPEEMPFYYESGTQNVHGLAGLNAGIEFILNETVEKIHKREMQLMKMLIEGLSKIKNIHIYGPVNREDYASVLSINIDGVDAADVATILDTSFNIAVRSGLHCAPDAHKTLNTFDRGGTVRISPGYFTTDEEIDMCVNALSDIADINI